MSPPSAGFGFGGLPVAEYSALGEGINGVCALGVDCELSRAFGKSNPGAASFIRRNSANLRPETFNRQHRALREAAGLAAERPSPHGFDVGLLLGDPDEVREDLVAVVSEVRQREARPMVVGCDHATSLWCARAAIGGGTTYLYLDAHLDLGYHLGEDRDTITNGSFVTGLLADERVEDVVNVGARAGSTFCAEYDDVPRLAVIRVPPGVLLPDELRRLKGRDVYVSIDADVMDPSGFPNVCSPEPFGLSPWQAMAIVGWIAQNCCVVGADFCEARPCPDQPHSAELAVRLLLEALS